MADDTRCPACAALLRPGDSWCGQCLTDLRDPAEVEVARAESAADAGTAAIDAPRPRARHAKPAEAAPLTRLLAEVSGVTATLTAPAPPTSTAPHPDEIPDEEWAAALAAAPLARTAQPRHVPITDDVDDELAVEDATEPGEQSVDVMLSLLAAGSDGGVSSWTDKLDSPGAKLGLVLGGGAVLMVGLLVGLTVLGSLIG